MRLIANGTVIQNRQSMDVQCREKMEKGTLFGYVER